MKRLIWLLATVLAIVLVVMLLAGCSGVSAGVEAQMQVEALSTQVAGLQATLAVTPTAMPTDAPTEAPEPAPVEPTATIAPLPADMSIYCKPDYFASIAVGYVPGLDVLSSESVGTTFACNHVTFSWANGSYIYGSVSDDGKSLDSCYYSNENQVIFDCSVTTKPNVDSGEMYARGWVYNRDSGEKVSRICLAQNAEAYSPECE